MMLADEIRFKALLARGLFHVCLGYSEPYV
jgi:hypothetical protein